jgi:hypothetical protein
MWRALSAKHPDPLDLWAAELFGQQQYQLFLRQAPVPAPLLIGATFRRRS